TVAPDPAAAGEGRGGRRERDVALPEREVAGLELLEDLAEDHLELARSVPGVPAREVPEIGAHLPRTRERAAQAARVRGPDRRLDLLEAPEERAVSFHGLGMHGPVGQRREADAADEQEEASHPHLGSMVDPVTEPGQCACTRSAASDVAVL